MPVFNGGHYFELALQSAVAQTYKNLEIVIVNDGSNDDGETAAIATKYAAHYPQIKYVFQENRGVGAALNTALNEMTGDIFTWLSHDDLFEPHKTARQVEFFNRLRHPSAMLFSDWYLIGPEGEVLQEVVYDHKELVQKPRLALIGGRINGVTLFIPRRILLEMGGFDEKYRFVQDYDLWNKLIAKHDFFHMPEKLIRYRSHPGQDTHKPGAVIESEDLWVRMINSRGEAEMVHLFGSSHKFYKFMAAHLQGSPFQRAAAYAEKRSAEVLGETLVSTIIPVANDDASFRMTLESVRAQVGIPTEILIVDMSSEGLSVDTHPQERLRVLRMPGARFGQALNKAALVSLGNYLSFARPGTQFVANRTWKQVSAMQLAGKAVSYTSYSSYASDQGGHQSKAFVQTPDNLLPAYIGQSNFRLETLMIHRVEFLGGLDLATWSDDDLLLSLSRGGSPLIINEPLVTLSATAA